MSQCSGPGCTHPSHRHEPPKAPVKQERVRKKLTKNQLKARRRKGVRGY